MKHTRIVLFAVALLAALLALPAQAQNQKEERINLSYLLAFGELPDSGSKNYWMGQPDKSVSAHYNNHRSWLKSNDPAAPAFREKAVVNSYKYAFNRNPTSAEKSADLRSSKTYLELVQQHRSTLDSWNSSRAAEKESLIRASYAAVGLSPSFTDMLGWKSGRGKVYGDMIKEHLAWIAKNAPGKMPRSQAKLSSAVLQEALAVSGGGSIVAAGAGNVVAGGGGNIVAAGGGNVVAGGGGN